MGSLTGGCLCGEVRYEISKDSIVPKESQFCHCRMCRTASGGPCLVMAAVQKEGVRWVTGKPKLYQSSEAVNRGFCANCGCQLTFVHSAMEDSVFFTLPTLDDPHDATVAPVGHIFCSEQLKWMTIEDGLPRHEKLHYDPSA